MRLGTQTWNPRLPLREAVEAWLTTHYGDPEQDGTSVSWSRTKTLGLHRQEIAFDLTDSDIRVDYTAHPIVSVFLLLVVSVFVYMVLGSSDGSVGMVLLIVFLLYVVVCWVLVSPRKATELQDIANVAEQTAGPYLVGVTAIGVLVLWYKFRSFYPASLVDRFMLVVILLGCGYIVSYDLIPGFSIGRGARILSIPVTALSWMLLTPLLFAIFALQPGWLYLRIQLYQQHLSQLAPTPGNLSVIRDATGQYSLETMELIAAENAQTVLILIAVVVVVLYILMGVQARRELENLKLIGESPFSSRLAKGLTLGGFLAANIGIVLLLIPAVSILSYGVFGDFPVSGADLVYTQAFTAQPMEVELLGGNRVTNSSTIERVVLFRESELVGPNELVVASYDVLKVIFRYTPFPPDLGALLIFVFLCVPIVVLIVGWLDNVIGGILVKARFLWEGEQLDRDPEIVPEKIPVLVIDDEEQPAAIAHPFSIVFGWRTYIVISDSVRETLSNDELDAVLAHEVYHIQNHDLKMTALATLFSLGFGGRNALLAFYDYPQIEKEADEFARETVGVRPTIIAIDKMDVLAKRSVGMDLPNSSPGFIDPSEVAEQTKNYWTSLRRRVDDNLSARFELLFGRVLLQSAHATAETRINRLRRNDQRDA